MSKLQHLQLRSTVAGTCQGMRFHLERDCWSTKLSPAMHLQACSNVGRQWHCILPDCQSLENSKSQGREDPTPPQKEVEAT